MLIINGRIYLEDRVIENGYVLTENETIKALGLMENVPAYSGEIVDAKGMNVLPGFIDQHIHGANGADNMDGTEEAVATIARFLPKEGTTSYCATTMTQSVEAVDKALGEIVKYAKNNNKPGEAEIVGIHLEGPFISAKHIGAQNPKYVLKPTLEAFDHFWDVSEGMIKVITYAPEEAEIGFTDHLRSLNVVPSAGHTDASCQQIEDEIENGLSNLTHFHNAMKPHHHREPGAVTAGFMNPTLKAEMICDGIHLNPDVVKATYQIKGAENFIAITDSMRAKGLPDGNYDLGGQEVIKKGKECRIATGSLAGSVAEMDFVVRNIKHFTGAPMHDLVKMSSENAAKHLEIFGRKGSIAINKDADIVICDDDINVQTTICRGVIGYQK
ncbi:N-acetylglucosamine-6-phosphate deacetylase [Erysipelothrix rhusiopathiae]|uniref:N-acetylglucosamine-6-phosphate deacetylase n=1 Tax=Erysipelothrix rhusiopathiae ATCC 19414 TaxID=525280 RepID=E7FVZ1_ERYRH|nr:N-acetylglucosamine-6-phosphate deacetylase [Erysipelothrix rhusiopathiae]AYV34291.1 N-acetylglucosamine-6-phosphate deacetylase [Erysipelothrix rhusiopathiae]EFY09061.1 N-acetylglucosamine-6-phosphate deacetylase [Erysipelothrix rhusiopathiae ATCC 19414]MCG4436482.1 N-acetylglucosamine-6-phosphate deacetylase [Erysipelothrix rhusiopathiae]MCG4456439.1 N-acetylglucosamine-6-phosphate deacetylase [Erysipelothrix rhusiopathiae]MDE8032300.1 N-acetylglucosamine-6-phosphate deacetylase [Erysipel